MTALPRRRRTRTIVALVAGVVVASSLPVFGVAASRTIANSKDGRNVANDRLPSVPLPATPTGLLAIVGDDGAVTSATVIVLSPAGVGGTIVSIPTTADRARSADDPASPLAEAFTEGGDEGVVSDVESMLSLTLNTSAIVTADEVEPILELVGDVRVAFPAAVVDAAGATIFTAGTTTLSPAAAAKFLATDPPGVPEANHRAAETAFWEGVADAVGDGRGDQPEDPTAAPEDFADLASRVFAGPVERWSFGATPLPPDPERPGVEIAKLDVGEVLLVLASVAPGAMSAPGDGVNYRVAFGFDNSALVAQLIAHLRSTGANVVSVIGAAVVPEVTEIYAADDLAPMLASELEPLIGAVDTRPATERIEDVDAVIVLGKSFLDQYPSGMPAPTTTIGTDV